MATTNSSGTSTSASTGMRRPFYLRPPWNILFEISKLEKLTPWNVNIAYLLNSFLSEMERSGKVDFRASGVALDSSALIYLMKSRLLLTLQEPPAPPKMPTDYVPPPLFLPLRHELTSTTIQHLLEVLDEVLKGEKFAHIDRVVAHPVLPSFSDLLPQFDAFLQEIELQMEKLLELLREKVKGAGIIDFSTLSKGIRRLEAIQMFILLLFLAQDGKVKLWQHEETEELYIAIGDLKLGENQQR
jgi:chromatin segregation and condensation protein Rec8/ScpA/Scc1 (kleisin family)